jgi:predicted O-linked N-acetylglucosamine transferase (SPINDLY family)
MSQVDMALDTFPFNGAITSFECLWMGIPVVTLTGELFSSRMGLNILSRLGLALFSATSKAEYVAKACSFAQQIDSLAQIRQSLRVQMLGSSLCDPLRLAREMEGCFRQIWQRWCKNAARHTRPGQGSVGLSP